MLWYEGIYVTTHEGQPAGIESPPPAAPHTTQPTSYNIQAGAWGGAAVVGEIWYTGKRRALCHGDVTAVSAALRVKIVEAADLSRKAQKPLGR